MTVDTWAMFPLPWRGHLLDRFVLDRSHAKHTNPRRIKLSAHTIDLKQQIKQRLATEDYTCRLPKVPKPRVRYKLTKYWYLADGMDKFQLVYA